MSIIVPTLGVAFAAVCIWLGVRVYNRREPWAKWTLAAVVAVPLLYVASFGPAWSYIARRYEDDPSYDHHKSDQWFDKIYLPIAMAMDAGPEPLGAVVEWYLELWQAD
jgi:hypothetical protein